MFVHILTTPYVYKKQNSHCATPISLGSDVRPACPALRAGNKPGEGRGEWGVTERFV